MNTIKTVAIVVSIILGVSSSIAIGWACLGIPFQKWLQLYYPNFAKRQSGSLLGVILYLIIISLGAAAFVSWFDTFGLLLCIIPFGITFLFFYARKYFLSQLEEKGANNPIK